MTIATSMLPEFDAEAATTRRVLAAVPEAHGAWRPHEKSFPLGDLAMHLANLPTWIGLALGADELDVAVEANRPDSRRFTTTAALLAEHDRNVAAARAALAAATDEHMRAPWTLRHGERVITRIPRTAVVRSFVLNHAIHHRGQLTVYLRLRDVPVPQVYGPTADAP